MGRSYRRSGRRAGGVAIVRRAAARADRAVRTAPQPYADTLPPRHTVLGGQLGFVPDRVEDAPTDLLGGRRALRVDEAPGVGEPVGDGDPMAALVVPVEALTALSAERPGLDQALLDGR